jgi:hypothetical protein
MLALLIMSIAEFFSSRKSLAQLSYDNLNDAFNSVQEAIEAGLQDEDPCEKLGPLDKCLSDARTYGTAARQEPRLWKAKWKFDLLDDVSTWLGFMKLDVVTMRNAMCGADGKTGGVFKVLGRLPEFEGMKEDLLKTIKSARDITYDLLSHEGGPFKGMNALDELEGLSELDGYQDAINHVIQVDGINFPDGDIITIEDDLLVQISIIFVMLENMVGRVSHIIGSCVREA